MSQTHTAFLAVCQHYKSKRWCVDACLLDAESGKRYLKSRERITRSTHPVTEIIQIDPPTGCWEFPQIESPPRGGEFYHLPGRTFSILGRHQTKPWKQT